MTAAVVMEAAETTAETTVAVPVACPEAVLVPVAVAAGMILSRSCDCLQFP